MNLAIVLVLLLIHHVQSAILNFETLGGVSGDDSLATEWGNGNLLNTTLSSLEPGDTLVFPREKTFHLMGGVEVHDLVDVTIQLDGELSFSDEIDEWPRKANGRVLECIHFYNASGLVFTSNEHRGLLNGNGQRWWDLPGIGYLKYVENRPRLFAVTKSRNIQIRNILFLDTPYWTTLIHEVDGLIIEDSDISARRTTENRHTTYDMTAFNTDGFDVTGRNVVIRNCQIWVQDDCIAIKDGSEHMLIENVNASGVGLTIGSIGSSVVNNITFRDSYLYNSFKGIYMKFRFPKTDLDHVPVESETASGGRISNILYENIRMDSPEQWPIWIGPAQQSDTTDLCYANPCSICFPILPNAKCSGVKESKYENIVFRNIQINNPKLGPGVVMADPTNPMTGVVFENVRVDYCNKEYLGTYEETFSNLPIPIHDSFVTSFEVGLGLCIVLLGVLPCIACIATGCCTRCFGKNASFRVLKCTVVSIVLYGLLFPLLYWLEVVQHDMSVGESYFRCEGVVNGTVRGDTWPIPQCFENIETDYVPSEICPNESLAGIALTTVYLVLAVGLQALVWFKCPDREEDVLEEFAHFDEKES